MSNDLYATFGKVADKAKNAAFGLFKTSTKIISTLIHFIDHIYCHSNSLVVPPAAKKPAGAFSYIAYMDEFLTLPSDARSCGNAHCRQHIAKTPGKTRRRRFVFCMYLGHFPDSVTQADKLKKPGAVGSF